MVAVVAFVVVVTLAVFALVVVELVAVLLVSVAFVDMEAATHHVVVRVVLDDVEGVAVVEDYLAS